MLEKNKQVITQKSIEQDIINSLKKLKEISKFTYQKLTIPCIIISCLLIIIFIFFPKIGLYSLLILFAIAVIEGAIKLLILRHKRKNVCIDNYEVITDVLSDTAEENYTVKSRKRSRRVNNYTLRFESSGTWRIPENNYVWSGENQMSNYFIYQNSHRGDAFYIVVEKSNGNIAVAYNAKFFDYKKG